MRKLVTVVVALAATLRLAADATHAHHDHGPVDLGKLGAVNFRTTCAKAVRKDFSRAVAMLHSFWYAEAEKAFGAVAAADPKCGMAHWGVAMSYYHPLWAPPAAEEFRLGREAAERARAVGASTERERAYIDAVNAFYRGGEGHSVRASAFAQAMEKVAAQNAEDDEAAIFHALALLGTASPSDKTYAVQKRAAEILNRMLPRQPEHPGIAHYVIHSYDYPALAELALPAARAYARIAPGSPHALHMPSHIFTRLGLWEESIASNTASAEKASSYIQQVRPGVSAFDELHAIDYLVYAYLQQGREERAKALHDRMTAVTELDTANLAAAYALAAVPARYALERRKWSDAAKLELRPETFPWKSHGYAEAIVHFARAIGAARSGDLNTAKAAIDRLAAIRAALLEQKNAYWAEQVEIQRVGALAWLAHAAGLKEEAVRLLRSAVDLEDRTEKHPVTPGAVIPARELLADMLLESGRAAEALAEAEGALKVAPNRHNGLALAARAAKESHDQQKAEMYAKTLAELTRPER